MTSGRPKKTPYTGSLAGVSPKDTEAIKKQVTLVQWQIYQTLRAAGSVGESIGLTNAELCARLDQHYGKKAKTTWLDRRNELYEMGYCRPTSGGNNQHVTQVVWIACLPWDEERAA